MYKEYLSFKNDFLYCNNLTKLKNMLSLLDSALNIIINYCNQDECILLLRTSKSLKNKLMKYDLDISDNLSINYITKSISLLKYTHLSFLSRTRKGKPNSSYKNKKVCAFAAKNKNLECLTLS